MFNPQKNKMQKITICCFMRRLCAVLFLGTEVTGLKCRTAPLRYGMVCGEGWVPVTWRLQLHVLTVQPCSQCVSLCYFCWSHWVGCVCLGHKSGYDDQLSTVSCVVPLIFPQSMTYSDTFCIFHSSVCFLSSKYWILFWSECFKGGIWVWFCWRICFFCLSAGCSVTLSLGLVVGLTIYFIWVSKFDCVYQSEWPGCRITNLYLVHVFSLFSWSRCLD